MLYILTIEIISLELLNVCYSSNEVTDEAEQVHEKKSVWCGITWFWYGECFAYWILLLLVH